VLSVLEDLSESVQASRMLEIGTSGSVRGVDALSMAEYCDTPQSKEGSNREYKECLSIRAIVHLLDGFFGLRIKGVRYFFSHLPIKI